MDKTTIIYLVVYLLSVIIMYYDVHKNVENPNFGHFLITVFPIYNTIIIALASFSYIAYMMFYIYEYLNKLNWERFFNKTKRQC